MTKSALREPPAGSELAARFAEIHEDKRDPEDPVLRELFELNAVINEPRLWKLPTEWVARHVVPVRIELTDGAVAAAELQQSPKLALIIAGLMQALDEAQASARKRATEPPLDHMALVRALIVAEFLNVDKEMPGASLTRRYMTTARRLSGNGAKIDRATVARAVKHFFAAMDRQPDEKRKAVTAALFFCADRYRPGWKKAA